MSEGNMILTPAQMKKQACKTEIKAICDKYGFQLVPVVTIIGNNMTTMVELAEAVMPTGQGQTMGARKDG